MNETIEPAELTVVPDIKIDAPNDNQATMNRWKIGLIWAFMSIVVIVLSAYLTGILLDALGYLSPALMVFFIPIGIAASILHPGGWLNLTGLALALKHRNYRWLYLSGAGAIITGIVTTFFILVGWGSIAV